MRHVSAALSLTLAVCLTLCLDASVRAEQDRPNLLIILVDD